MPDTMTLLWSIKSKITKIGNDKNIHCLKIFEVVLVHGSKVNNDEQHESRALHTFAPNKSFRQLLDISLK